MILPADTLAPMDKSYRPDSADAPHPTMVVEVVSDSDTFSGIGAKVGRYLRLGVPCLVIDLAPDSTNLVLHRPRRTSDRQCAPSASNSTPDGFARQSAEGGHDLLGEQLHRTEDVGLLHTREIEVADDMTHTDVIECLQ